MALAAQARQIIIIKSEPFHFFEAAHARNGYNVMHLDSLPGFFSPTLFVPPDASLTKAPVIYSVLQHLASSKFNPSPRRDDVPIILVCVIMPHIIRLKLLNFDPKLQIYCSKEVGGRFTGTPPLKKNTPPFRPYRGGGGCAALTRCVAPDGCPQPRRC